MSLASTVRRLFIYPIKSCRGIEVSSAEVTPRGLRFDRRLMLIDADGRFLTQRRFPRMAQIGTGIEGDDLVVNAPGRESLRLPLAPDSERNSICRVRIWADEVEATLADPGANIWFSEFLGFACGLVFMADDQHRPVPNELAAFDDEVSFADAAPVLLLSDASLAGLNARLAAPVGIERFRPNIVVSAGAPHAEDSWESLAIGASRFDVAWGCSRCNMPTLDPVTGEKHAGGEPMATLMRYRRRNGKVWFGQNLIPRAAGSIRVGDACQINEIIPA